jgi:hypothetical protein
MDPSLDLEAALVVGVDLVAGGDVEREVLDPAPLDPAC